MTMKTARLALSALVLALGLGCESIAGIEDRVYDPNDQVSEECRKYCDTVMNNCTGDLQVYTTDTTCLGICGLLDPGDPLEPAGNTVACRTREASLAITTGEPEQHCPRAGPGGGGVCGEECESYCELYARACSAEIEDPAECVEKCAAFEDQARFHVDLDHEGDTLECRLQHVSSAAVAPDPHCDHARFVSTEWCFEPPNAAPECADYCRIITAACTGDVRQYESVAQCMAVCEALEPGLNLERVENTVGCRKYHSYSSIFDPATHCSHAGPSGDGHCGPPTPPDPGPASNCVSYCRLLEAACSADFAQSFTDQDECVDSCGAIDGAAADSKYSVNVAAGPTLQCRFLELARAFANPSACSGALGGAPCQ